jgi:hypothetical protein
MAFGRRIGWWVTGVAVAGAVAGHACTYAALQPDADARGSLLLATGHAWVHLANDAGAVLAVIALTAAVLGRITRQGADVSTTALFRRLAAFQVLAFVAMEVGERLAVGASLDAVFAGGLLPIGICVQLVIAAVAAVGLRHVLRSIDGLITAAPPVAPPRRASIRIVSAVRASRRGPALQPSSIRAPPSYVR